MRNVLHRVYGGGVCLNRIDLSSCWALLWIRGRRQILDFYRANTLYDSLLFRLSARTHNPLPINIHALVQKRAHFYTHKQQQQYTRH